MFNYLIQKKLRSSQTRALTLQNILYVNNFFFNCLIELVLPSALLVSFNSAHFGRLRLFLLLVYKK